MQISTGYSSSLNLSDEHLEAPILLKDANSPYLFLLKTYPYLQEFSHLRPMKNGYYFFYCVIYGYLEKIIICSDFSENYSTHPFCRFCERASKHIKNIPRAYNEQLQKFVSEIQNIYRNFWGNKESILKHILGTFSANVYYSEALISYMKEQIVEFVNEEQGKNGPLSGNINKWLEYLGVKSAEDLANKLSVNPQTILPLIYLLLPSVLRMNIEFINTDIQGPEYHSIYEKNEESMIPNLTLLINVEKYWIIYPTSYFNYYPYLLTYHKEKAPVTSPSSPHSHLLLPPRLPDPKHNLYMLLSDYNKLEEIGEFRILHKNAQQGIEVTLFETNELNHRYMQEYPTATDKLVIKVVSFDESNFEKMKEEWEIMSHCHNICPAIIIKGLKMEVHAPHRKLIFVLEYGGRSLEECIYACKYPLPDIIFWLGELLKGLALLEKSKKVHMDIKPLNLLYKDCHIKIIDFGVATSLSSNPTYKLAMGNETLRNKHGKGCTFPYMPPEILISSPPYYLTRIDPYSLGITFVRIITLVKEQEIDQLKLHQMMGHQDYNPDLFNLKIIELLYNSDHGQHEMLPKIISLLMPMLRLNPYERPSFQILDKIFRKYLMETSESLDQRLSAQLMKEQFVTLDQSLTIHKHRVINPPRLNGLLCLICSGLLQDPLQCSQCKHHFCAKCIQHWVKYVGDYDPYGCKEFNLIPPQPTFLDSLNLLKISCKYSDKGCQVTTNIEEAFKHEEECKYQNQNIKISLIPKQADLTAESNLNLSDPSSSAPVINEPNIPAEEEVKSPNTQEEPLERLNRLLSLLNNTIGKTGEETAMTNQQIADGDKLIEEGKVTEALIEYEKARSNIAEKPSTFKQADYFAINNKIADALQSLGRFDEAAETYDLSLANYLEHSTLAVISVHYLKSNMYDRLKDYDRSLVSLEAAQEFVYFLGPEEKEKSHLLLRTLYEELLNQYSVRANSAEKGVHCGELALNVLNLQVEEYEQKVASEGEEYKNQPTKLLKINTKQRQFEKLRINIEFKLGKCYRKLNKNDQAKIHLKIALNSALANGDSKIQPIILELLEIDPKDEELQAVIASLT